MPASVKMLAVVNGESVEVGRCHPGQARLLRKNGLAEWKEGKIHLKTPPDWREQYIDGTLNNATRSLMMGHEIVIGAPPAPGEKAPPAMPLNLDDPITRAIHEARVKLLRGEGVRLTSEGVFPVITAKDSFFTTEEFLKRVAENREKMLNGEWDEPLLRNLGLSDAAIAKKLAEAHSK